MSAYSISLSALNRLLACPLCKGYFREAHTIAECMHTMCKSCLYKKFYETACQSKSGTISCPVCNMNVGVYSVANVNSKVIYDRNKQAVVDRIFPHFLTEETQQEVLFNEELAAKKRPLQSDDGEQASKKVKTEETITDDFKVRLEPLKNCKENAKLPELQKNAFRAHIGLKLIKVQKFISRRLEHITPSLVAEEVIVSCDTSSYGDLTAESEFRDIEDAVNSAKLEKRSLVLQYRRRIEDDEVK